MGFPQSFYALGQPFRASNGRYGKLAGTFGLGVRAWDDPEAYLRNSPLFFAEQVVSPVFLIHTDMDVFAMRQYDMFFSALSRQRKDAQYARYFGEGHGPSSPANIRDMWERIFMWFDTYVGGAQVSETNGE